MSNFKLQISDTIPAFRLIFDARNEEREREVIHPLTTTTMIKPTAAGASFLVLGGFALQLATTALKVVAAAAFSGVSTQRVFVSTPKSRWPKRTVGDCCQRTFVTLSPTTTVDEAMNMFLSLRVQGAPVIDSTERDDNELVGMVSQFDFLSKEAFEGALLPLERGGSRENLQRYVEAAKQITGSVVSDIMTSAEDSLVAVTPETSMQEAAELMRRHRLHHLPVVADDTSRRVVGLLTSEDVLRDLLHVVQYLPEESSATAAVAAGRGDEGDQIP